MCVGFKNTCTASGKWNISKVVPKLFVWTYKTNKSVISVSSLQFITVGSQPGKLISNPRINIFCLSSYKDCVQIQWRIKFCLFRYFGFLRTACYYSRVGLNRIILFMVTQRNEDAGWDQYFIFMFLMLINEGVEEWGSVVRLKFLCLNSGLERCS